MSDPGRKEGVEVFIGGRGAPAVIVRLNLALRAVMFKFTTTDAARQIGRALIDAADEVDRGAGS